MKLIQLIKNMVCRRCIMSVEEALQNVGIDFEDVILGEIHLKKPLPVQKKEELKAVLKQKGFELIDDRMGGIIEKIKALIIQKSRGTLPQQKNKLKLSTLLSEELHYEYSHLSTLFSQIEGRTIENYLIEQRIEYAKELIIYGQLSLSEIADQLEYSSVAHLSSQFKKVTGLTPSFFKKIGSEKRKAIDSI